MDRMYVLLPDVPQAVLPRLPQSCLLPRWRHTISGRAVVVDPQRDIQQYLADAAQHGLTIERVIETHFHVDFLSGHLELAAATGAVISYGTAATGHVEFAIEPLAYGQRLSLGTVELEIRATPGHTPESVSVVLYESPGSSPYGVLTGDTLFIGDVGRPDLLSAIGVSAVELATSLYQSVHTQLMTLPDDTLVFPAHGAGSSCGKNLSTETNSTIGEQRHSNYAVQPMTVADFVETVTQGQSAAPLYFPYAASRNREERDLFDEGTPARLLAFDELVDLQQQGAAIVDARDNASFAAGHIAGSINVGIEGRYAEFVGEVIRAGTPIVLVTDPGEQNAARTRLVRIGFDSVVGALEEPVRAMATHPEHVRQASRLTALGLADRLAGDVDVVVIDVRNPSEVDNGAIPDAISIPLPELLERSRELSPTRPTVVYCAGGYRSSVAASLLRSLGFTDVSDLIGGFGAWSAAGLGGAAPRR